MKKVLLVLVLIYSCMFMFGCSNQKVEESYLRIHIRANSNSTSDQTIKYKIKDEIVSFLTPYIANCKSLDEVKTFLNQNINLIKQKTDEILTINNFNYASNVSVNNEFFPTRVYDGLMLEENYYDALIIELGSAVGDNWWCVVYPPLCFVGAENINGKNIIYKSKLLEIINKYL